jgi:hypothetical protein
MVRLVSVGMETAIKDYGFNAQKFFSENYGSFAVYENNGVTISETRESDGTGWGDHTAEENAEYLMLVLEDDGFHDLEYDIN